MVTSVYGDGRISTHAEGVNRALAVSGGDWRLSAILAAARRFVRFGLLGELLGEQSSPKLGDSLPCTPMNHRAKFDTASFILAGESRNRTNTKTNKTVNDISTHCLSAYVDKNVIRPVVTNCLFASLLLFWRCWAADGEVSCQENNVVLLWWTQLLRALCNVSHIWVDWRGTSFSPAPCRFCFQGHWVGCLRLCSTRV